LLQILVLFADTESISKKYKLTAKAGEDLSAYSTGDMDPKMVLLDNKMRALATQRQKKGRFLKLASWALYHRSTLKGLLEQIAHLSTRSRNYSPHLRPKPRLSNKKQQRYKQSLELIEDAATGVDNLLQKTVKEVISGHQYSNIGIKG
jgi:uncharacterized small protein (DUF1192 family)